MFARVVARDVALEMLCVISKSILSTTVGVAHDRGLIPDVHQPVRRLVPTEHFAHGANSRITWNHLLRQTSDWEGTLWEKPDWGDRPPREVPIGQYRSRLHAEPGATYKYNDVRVNLLAYAALQVIRKPLPVFLREEIMDPIGASPTWRWEGYTNSWVNIDGQRIQSVSGGGHYGGGMFISARDMARFGLLTLNQGEWAGRRIVSADWLRQAVIPTEARPNYGFMNFFLNPDQSVYPHAPASAYAHRGNGTNLIYCDPEHDIVAVVRWIQGGAIDGFFEQLLAGIDED